MPSVCVKTNAKYAKVLRWPLALMGGLAFPQHAFVRKMQKPGGWPGFSASGFIL